MSMASGSSDWQINPAMNASSTTGWSVPMTITEDGLGNFVAEMDNSRWGIFGTGPTRAAAIADLRDAIREFACVLGVVRCERHR